VIAVRRRIAMPIAGRRRISMSIAARRRRMVSMSIVGKEGLAMAIAFGGGSDVDRLGKNEDDEKEGQRW